MPLVPGGGGGGGGETDPLALHKANNLSDVDDAAASRTNIGAGTGDMLGANNLSDVSNVITARGNIGAGTGDGDLISTNNLSDVNDAMMSRFNLGAGTGDGDMLGANNLSDVADAATARTNLGITGGVDGPTFRAYLSANQAAIPASSAATIVFDTADFDSATTYNTVTGIYTVDTSGVYLVTAKVADFSGVGTQADASIWVDPLGVGSYVLRARGNLPTTTVIYDTFYVTTHLALSATDLVRIEVEVFVGSGSVTPRGDAGGVRSYFSMARVGSTP